MGSGVCVGCRPHAPASCPAQGPEVAPPCWAVPGHIARARPDPSQPGRQAAISLVLCAVEVASAGVLLAGRQFGYLIRAMALTLGALLASRLWAGGALLARGGLGGVWWGLVAFFALRAGQSAARVAVLYWRRAPAAAPA